MIWAWTLSTKVTHAPLVKGHQPTGRGRKHNSTALCPLFLQGVLAPAAELMASVQPCICWTIWTAGRALPGVRASLRGCIPSPHPCRLEPFAIFSCYIILHTKLSFYLFPSQLLFVDNAAHTKPMLDAVLQLHSVSNRPILPLQCHAI